MMAGLAVLVFLNIMAILLGGRCGGRRLLNLGVNRDSDKVARALKTCAQQLMDLEISYMTEMCRGLKAIDLNAITQAAQSRGSRSEALRLSPSWLRK